MGGWKRGDWTVAEREEAGKDLPHRLQREQGPARTLILGAAQPQPVVTLPTPPLPWPPHE